MDEVASHMWGAIALSNFQHWYKIFETDFILLKSDGEKSQLHWPKV